MQTRAKIIVKGEVQRVGYRDAVGKIARKLDIRGFVQNLKPYDVKIVCEGEEGDIKRFIGALKIEGDPLISVSDVAVEYEKSTGEYKYFEIKRGSREEEDAERWDEAAGYLKTLIREMNMMHSDLKEDTKYIPGVKADTGKMLEKQDRMLEKQDDTIKEIRNVSGKIDQGKEEIVTEISSLRGDLKSYMANKFAKIEYEIAEIKTKIGLA